MQTKLSANELEKILIDKGKGTGKGLGTTTGTRTTTTATTTLVTLGDPSPGRTIIDGKSSSL